MSVFPVAHPWVGGDGKTPAVRWRRYQTARASASTVRRWFDGPELRNYAVVTSGSPAFGPAVVDLDLHRDPHVGPWWADQVLPETPCVVSTGGGGEHRLFRADPRLTTSAGLLGMAVDIRARGGYVVGPGSRHASGRLYTVKGESWTRDDLDNLPELPVDLFPHARERAETARRGPSTSTRHETPAPGAILLRAGRYAAGAPIAQVGARNDAANRLAWKLLKGFGVDLDDALLLLRTWNYRNPAPLPDYELVRTVRSAERGRRFEPRFGATSHNPIGGGATIVPGARWCALVQPPPLSRCLGACLG